MADDHTVNQESASLIFDQPGHMDDYLPKLFNPINSGKSGIADYHKRKERKSRVPIFSKTFLAQFNRWLLRGWQTGKR